MEKINASNCPMLAFICALVMGCQPVAMRVHMLPSSSSGNIYFSGQRAYPHGTHMCTTACMHVAVAALCKLLDVGNASVHVLKSKIDSIMQLASRSHAGFESSGHPRMLSVHEILRECGIDLAGLGIRSHELFLVERHSPQTRHQTECFVEARFALHP